MRPGAAEQARQLPDQCIDKPRYTYTERPPLWIHSYALGTRLEGKSVYESNVSGGHIIRAFVEYDGRTTNWLRANYHVRFRKGWSQEISSKKLVYSL